MPWIQYTIDDGITQSTLDNKVADADLALLGKAQIECPPEMGDPNQYDVDITQIPHVLIRG